MAPAFIPAQIRTFLTMFRASAVKVSTNVLRSSSCQTDFLVSPFQLSQKWKEEVISQSEEGKDVPVNRWLARTTLDILGEGTSQPLYRSFYHV